MSPLERENREIKKCIRDLKIKRRRLFFYSIPLFLISAVLILFAIFSTVKVNRQQNTLQNAISEKGTYQVILANGYMARDEIADVSNSICNCIIDDAKLEAEEKVEKAKNKAQKILADKKFKVVFSEKYKLARPVVLSEYEQNLLCHVVQAEAGSEKKEGQMAVCWVVLNRIASKRFPNSVYKVIYASGQFDCVKNGSINKSPSKEVKDSVNQVIYGKVPDMTYGALYYRNPSISSRSTDSWFNSKQNTVRIGNHVFYK